MIPYGKPVFVASKPVDMRCGFDRLAEHANAQLGVSVAEGCVVRFVNCDRHEGARGASAQPSNPRST